MVSPDERDDVAPDAADGEVCNCESEEVRTSITTTTMKKGNYKEKERPDNEETEHRDITENRVVTDDES